MQLCSQIKAKANAQGVKNFMALWKAYLETVTRQQGISLDNSTAFDGQPIELLCGEYTCDDQCVSVIDRFGFEIVVCSHPIMPIQRLVNIDTDEVKIELAFKRGNIWRTLIFDKKTLASSQQIISLASYGIAVDSENSRDLVKYLTTIETLNYEKLGEISSVGRLGWIRHNDFSPYVENVRFDGDLQFKAMFGAVKPTGSYEEWLALVKEIRKSGTVARIALAASFASALVEPCNSLPFIVHLWGGTEAGKTVGLMLAASVWANPSLGEYIRTFNTTSVGLELYAGFCNSLPLCLDELQIVKNRGSFDDLIYMLTEGIGRGRGAKAGGLQRLQTWRNCTITTGEMPISTGVSGGGAVNRVVEVDCKDEKLFDDPRHVVDVLRKNYGFAGKLFIENLQREGWREFAIDAQKQFYAQLIEGESTEKQAMAGSLILAADYLIDIWLFEDGITIKASDLKQYLTDKATVDQNQRAYEWLLDFIASNPARFAPSANGDYTGECWGATDEHRAYINKSIFDAKMNEAGFNPVSFLSWARRRQLVECDKGHNTKLKRIIKTNNPVRCIWLVLPDSEEDFADVTACTASVTASEQIPFR